MADPQKLAPEIGGGEPLDDNQDPIMGGGQEIQDGDLSGSPEDADYQISDEGVGDLQALMRKKGFKSAGEVAAFLTNSEQQITKLSNDLRKQSFIPEPPPAYLPVYPPAPSNEPLEDDLDIDVPEDPSDFFTDPGKFKTWAKGFANKVRSSTTNQVNKQRAHEFQENLKVQIARKIQQNPEEFHKRRGKMLEISNVYPTASLDWLYDQAGTRVEQEKDKQVDEFLTRVGLTREQLAHVKTLTAKGNPVPPHNRGGGSVPSDVNLSPSELEAKKIRDGILKSGALPE